MTEEKEMWTIEELVSMTDTVQTHEIAWQGKNISIQWCELVESEEPKLALPADDVPDAEQTEYYKEIASQRVSLMIAKANKKRPDTVTVTEENWAALPTTLRWSISAYILGTQDSENFTTG